MQFFYFYIGDIMVGYDFDKTIYKRDCSVHFFFYMIFTRIYLLLFSPYFLIVFALYGLKWISKKRFKEFMFFFVPFYGKRIYKIVDKFWQKNANGIFDWYSKQKSDDDIIISAGLKFIVEPVAKMLNVKTLIATEFDVKKGKIVGENCYGEEKKIQFEKYFPNQKCTAFYSDSYSDLPMMKISDKAYLVKGETVTDVTEKVKNM